MNDWPGSRYNQLSLTPRKRPTPVQPQLPLMDALNSRYCLPGLLSCLHLSYLALATPLPSALHSIALPTLHWLSLLSHVPSFTP